TTVRVRVTDDGNPPLSSFRDVTITVLDAHPPVKIQSAKSPAKNGKISSIVLTFSGALDARSAVALAGYELWSAGKDKKVGTKDDKRLKLRVAAYNKTAHTVTLTPTTKIAANTNFQLLVHASSVTDLSGRPIDGNHDNARGGDAK